MKGVDYSHSQVKMEKKVFLIYLVAFLILLPSKNNTEVAKKPKQPRNHKLKLGLILWSEHSLDMRQVAGFGTNAPQIRNETQRERNLGGVWQLLLQPGYWPMVQENISSFYF